ncbi:hypothetical protein DNH61_20635 [Paenibacillus sambharensis]|uniref:Uncharacterized protein n=1 Tax=Paenibacillus sambharensis TaxID=1803190 RepID=A0A2W1LR68_9BACL|nr:hypothetical protein [Paenibacillus sambharensis]PZD93907.1 hypothetical protein DNH61_20635 [Paenibacillus sambharensis]
MISRWFRQAAGLLALLLFIWFVHPPLASAEQAQEINDEELRLLLEKSLSITELDKEIARIGAQKEQTLGRIRELTQLIERKSVELQEQEAKAGDVIRAYYTGERDSLIGAVLSFQSLPDLFLMLDYFDVIIANDKKSLDGYKEQYRELQKEREKLAEDESRLSSLETSLLAQRERIVRLQSDVDSSLASSGDADRLRVLIDELVAYWETAGMHEVKRYFRALAETMKELPGWLQENPRLMEMNGLSYTLRLPDDELNRFLREQNDLFDNFQFRFENGLIAASGRREGMEISLTGHYLVEDEPVHAIRFYTDELKFNGLTLPDTTVRDLEDSFDLSFYPQRLVSFVKADSVVIEDGELVIKLSVALE